MTLTPCDQHLHYTNIGWRSDHRFEVRAEVVRLTSRSQKYEAQTVLTVLKLWHHETVHSFEEVKAEQKRIADERGLPDPEPLLAEEEELGNSIDTATGGVFLGNPGPRPRPPPPLL